MSNQQITVRRKDGADRITHVASGPFEWQPEGDGPWTIDAALWKGLGEPRDFEPVPDTAAPSGSPKRSRAPQE